VAGRQQREHRGSSRGDERQQDERRTSSIRADDAEPLELVEVARVAVEHIAALTGKQLLGVTSVESNEDGWVVGLEVLEDERIPSSADILALYAARIDPDGELLGYRRTSRYLRGSTDRGSPGGTG
jgi:hypothetical protein